jgi:hypothetical protein
MAKAFTGHKSNQVLIDEALRSYLLQLRRTNDNYRIAAEALDRDLQRDGENVAPITRARRKPAGGRS